MLDLSNKDKSFPEEIIVEGKKYAIYSDFRNILKIIKLIEDRRVLAFHKNIILKQMFYVDDAPERFIEHMGNFIFGKEGNNSAEKEKVFDFVHDGEEIFASFYGEYSIDLAKIEYLHWRKFLILLKNLSNKSAFKEKIGLRTLDISKFDGENLQKAIIAKEKTKLPEKISPQDFIEIKKFKEKWASAGEGR